LINSESLVPLREHCLIIRFSVETSSSKRGTGDSDTLRTQQYRRERTSAFGYLVWLNDSGVLDPTLKDATIQ
jgi:hypothetical protein